MNANQASGNKIKPPNGKTVATKSGIKSYKAYRNRIMKKREKGQFESATIDLLVHRGASKSEEPSRPSYEIFPEQEEEEEEISRDFPVSSGKPRVREPIPDSDSRRESFLTRIELGGERERVIYSGPSTRTTK